MKIIAKVVTLFSLAIILTACSEAAMDSSAIATEAVKTALVQVETALAETQSALPTNTSTPSPLPTFALPSFTITPAVLNSSSFVPPPEARLDYAMSIAPKVYNRLPYIGEDQPRGEYNGCADTNDFSTVVYYGINHPLDTVTSAFASYFKKERWAFTEATTELVGDKIKLSLVSFNVYRILPDETPAFERLEITLTDDSIVRERDHVDVRLVLTHVETKSNVEYLGDFFCGPNNHWLWIRFSK